MTDTNLIELIKVLRERTGAGMMDCKKALIASNNDIEKAIVWLREQGIAKAAAKAARIAAEGAASFLVKGDLAGIAEINCETDFVARSDRFKTLLKAVLEKTLEEKPASIEKARELTAPLFADATIALGEKLDYRRFSILEKKPGECFGGYVHMGGKIAVLVHLHKDDPELAKGLAMHIAANDPKYIRTEDIPEPVKVSEKDIALKAASTDPKLAGKPADLLARIAERKAASALAEATLYEQEYLIDGKNKVREVMCDRDNAVLKFVRYSVGEGLAKPETCGCDGIITIKK